MAAMDRWMEDIWPVLVFLLGLIVPVTASAHVVLYKRDVRAAIGWVGLIWLTPIVGVILYVLLGINRIRRRAVALHRALEGGDQAHAVDPAELKARLGPHSEHLTQLAGLGRRVTQKVLTAGNRVEVLCNGDETFPSMLEAIDSARESVHLMCYIFDDDELGRRFAEALGRARKRGVHVRVLIDAVGLRYSWPRPITKVLRAKGVNAARFLPTRVPWRMPYANLRNHRKILVVDGRVGFTGGMNLRKGNLVRENPSDPIADLHFRMTGPVVFHLQQSFVEDWLFATGKELGQVECSPKLERAGAVFARGISDGPDDDFEKLRWTFMGAIAAARHSIRIVTPYFLPDEALLGALSGAALRGVRVDIVIPEKNNLVLVGWACQAQLWQVLEHGVRVWFTPPPFDHSKLFIVDDAWACVGSANWDARSLRLNFEFNVELYGNELAQQLDRLVEQKIAVAHEVTIEGLRNRPLLVRLRNGAARLLSPYL